jgi:threonine dehydrogenase-like Zn-dependent dehydrogenase
MDRVPLGKLTPQKMITGKFPLDKAEEAFKTLLEDRDHHCKVLVEVHGG